MQNSLLKKLEAALPKVEAQGENDFTAKQFADAMQLPLETARGRLSVLLRQGKVKRKTFVTSDNIGRQITVNGYEYIEG